MQRADLSIAILMICLSAGTLLASPTANTEPTNSDAERAGLAQDAASQMNRWLKASRPGEAHQRLDELEGRYDIRIRAWLTSPDQPPLQAEGKAEYRWLLGDRWLQQTLQSRLMGLPYEGLGMLGYDRIDGHYASYWQDSLSTATRSSFGQIDESSNRLVMRGTADDPATGAMDQPVRYEISLGEPSGHVFRAYDLTRPEGQQLAMEITYTRITPEPGETADAAED